MTGDGIGAGQDFVAALKDLARVSWTGTAAELLTALPLHIRPPAANALSRRLADAEADLAGAGVVVVAKREAGTGRRLLALVADLNGRAVSSINLEQSIQQDQPVGPDPYACVGEICDDVSPTGDRSSGAVAAGIPTPFHARSRPREGQPHPCFRYGEPPPPGVFCFRCSGRQWWTRDQVAWASATCCRDTLVDYGQPPPEVKAT